MLFKEKLQRSKSIYLQLATRALPLPAFQDLDLAVIPLISWSLTNSAWHEIRELPPLQLLNGIYQWCLTKSSCSRYLKISKIGLRNVNFKVPKAVHEMAQERRVCA
jgi:hypothetical protein